MTGIYTNPWLYDFQYLNFHDDIEFWVKLASDFRGNSVPVLELACGTFRVTLELARRGIPVVGVDVSPVMLEHGRYKLNAESEHIRSMVQAVEGDMRSINLPTSGKHKLVIVPFTAFNHMLTPEDQRATLVNIKKQLAPGGYFLADLFNPDLSRLNRALAFDSMVVDSLSGERLIRHAMSTHDHSTGISMWSFVCERFNLSDGISLGRTYTETEVAVITPDAWRELLKKSGYIITKEWGSYDLDPFDEVLSKRMLFLCQVVR